MMLKSLKVLNSKKTLKLLMALNLEKSRKSLKVLKTKKILKSVIVLNPEKFGKCVKVLNSKVKKDTGP